MEKKNDTGKILSMSENPVPSLIVTDLKPIISLIQIFTILTQKIWKSSEPIKLFHFLPW